MLQKPSEEAIYVSSSSEIPPYLQQIMGLRLVKCSTFADVQKVMQQKPDIRLFVVHCDGLSEKAMEGLKRIPHQLPNAKVLVIAGSGCKYMGSTLASSSLVVLTPNQGLEIRGILGRFVQGHAFKVRRFDRQVICANVMVKRSSYSSDAPLKSQVDLLGDAVMVDFSRGGAQVVMQSARIERKDLVSLLYQNQMGQWTTIESQVRWVSETPDGRFAMGLQFVALAG